MKITRYFIILVECLGFTGCVPVSSKNISNHSFYQTKRFAGAEDSYEQLEQQAWETLNMPSQQVDPMAVALAKMSDAMAERYTGMAPMAGHMVDVYQERAKEQEIRRQQALDTLVRIYALPNT